MRLPLLRPGGLLLGGAVCPTGKGIHITAMIHFTNSTLELRQFEFLVVRTPL
jgi:hypothetical protein